jgi:hypothetical protein
MRAMGLLEDRPELAELLEAAVPPGNVVAVDDYRVLLALGHLHGHDLALELAGVDGRDGPLGALQRELVLVLARDVVLLGDALGGVAHVEVVVDLPEAVLDHGVDQDAVAQAVAGARLGHQVRRVAHALGPAGDHHLGLARPDGVGRLHHRLEPRAADEVQRPGRHRVGQTGAQRGLAADVLAEARADHVADDHLVDRARVELAPLQQRLDGRRGELRRRDRAQRAQVAGQRGAHRVDDYDLVLLLCGHDSDLPSLSSSCRSESC